MSEKTAIAWTATQRPDGTWAPGATFNPWWGCVKVSEGCHHCYAETFSKRVGQAIWGPASTTPRRLFGAKHWQEPLKWNAAAEAAGERRRVFCASMADVFEDHSMVEPERLKLWQLIEATPALDWQLLTKRPENVLAMVPAYWTSGTHWPSNAWIGTSAEHQEAADLRIPILMRIPAPVRFVSAEPLLGPINLYSIKDRESGRFLDAMDSNVGDQEADHGGLRLQRVNWVIVGGESGPKHRPLNVDWARDLRDQCTETGTAFFFKQHGGRTHAEGGNLLDGQVWQQFPEPLEV